MDGDRSVVATCNRAASVRWLFIVGCPKCGTTALHTLLSRHPLIDGSRPKEPHYWCVDFHRLSDDYHGDRVFFSVRRWDQYMACFRALGPERLALDSSTSYLRSERAPVLVAERCPDARVIICLRDPKRVLVSLHKEFLRDGYESIPEPIAAIEASSIRARGEQASEAAPFPAWLDYWAWVDWPAQIQRWMDAVGPDRVYVVIQEEFAGENACTVRRLLAWLGLPELRLDHGHRPVNTYAARRPARWARLLLRPRVRAMVRQLVPPTAYDVVWAWASRLLTRPVDDRTRQREQLAVAEVASAFATRIGDLVAATSELLKRDLAALWGYR